MATVILRPNANGGANNWDPVGASLEYECVDEAVANSDTDYIRYTSGTAKVDRYTLPTSGIEAGLTINSVTVYWSHKKEAAFPNASRPLVRIGSTNYYGSYATETTSYVASSNTWATSPATGSAWTLDEVNALQIGVEANQVDPNRYVRVTQVYVEIDYNPPPASFVQKHYRFYNDDAGLNSAAAKAAEDTEPSAILVGENFRLRIKIYNAGGQAGNITRRLEYRENGGGWQQVQTGSGNVRLASSSHFADGDAATQRLTAEGAFTAGQGKESGSDTSQISLTNAYSVEDEWCLKFEIAAGGKSYDFRVTNAGSALNTYTVTPLVDALGIASWQQSHFRAYRDEVSLNGATAIASEDIDPGEIISLGTFRLRFTTANAGNGGGSVIRRLEFNESGGGWQPVYHDTGNVRVAGSSYFNDGEATSQRLSGAGSFIAGQGKEDSGSTGALSLTDGYGVEDEFNLLFPREAEGKTYQFRLTNDGAAYDSYSAVPSITAIACPPIINGGNILTGAREIAVDGVDIGALEGGVQILHESARLIHRVDQVRGTVAGDKIDELLRCKFTIKEATLENLRIAMAQPSYQLSVGVGESTLNLGGRRALPTHTVQIRGKAPGTNKTRTIYFNKCVVEEGGVHTYRREGATLYEVTLICLADASLPEEGYQVGYFEDDSGAFTFA